MGEENWMSKVIFFKNMSSFPEAIKNFNMDSFRGKSVPVKLHMGALHNRYYTHPNIAKKVVEILKTYDADPFMFDTTVAYPGLRGTKIGHRKLSNIHGFTKKNVGCKVVIDGENGTPVKIKGRTYIVAEHIHNYDNIFAISHVKGHVGAGFGGAIKNFGMGGVTKKTKTRMHRGAKPVHQKDNCTYCGICEKMCPFNMIKVTYNKWKFNNVFCFGCGVCVENCNSKGLIYRDIELQFSLACAAKACVQNKNVIYLNDVNRIAQKCDCDPKAGPVICPDIGFLLSDDPVAIDKASLDLVNKVKPDVFKKYNKVDPENQIKYGEEIGLGSASYELIES